MPAVEERRLSLEEFLSTIRRRETVFRIPGRGSGAEKHAHQTALETSGVALGYEAGQEVTLKLDPAYEPIADVIAAEGSIGDLYPTEPLEIAIEILSPEDSFSRMVTKCGLYKKWGIRRVVVIDPIAREVWSFEAGSLQKSDIIARRGGQAIMAFELWAEVDRVLALPQIT